MHSIRSLVALCVLLIGASAPEVAAQQRLLDEGTFSLYRAGERVGREDFSIRPSPGGSAGAFVAQGNLLLGDRRLTVRLHTDSSGAPLRFTLEEARDGALVETISGEARRDLWSGRANRRDGESAREFRMPRGTLASESTVIHHLWFLLRFGEGRALNVLDPRTFAMETVSVEDAGPDRVSLGLREFVSRKWIIRPASGRDVREAWTDLDGRLLRVRIPDGDLEAIRDEPPPETPGGLMAYDTMEPFSQDLV